DQIQLDEAALLILVVNHIQRIEDRLYAGVRTPQRNAKTDYEGEGELAVIVAGDARDLIADQFVGARGHHARDETEVRVDRARLREQAVERNQRGDGGHDGQHGVEGHSGCSKQQAVLPDVLVDPPENVL